MAVSYNKVILAGNLTRKPETRQFGDGKSVTAFGLAINHRYKKGEETKEEVTFIDVEAFGKTGELVAQYLDKGSSALIEGRLKLDQWEDKDGQKRSKLKVVADGVQFLSSKRDAEPLPSEQAAPVPRIPAPAGGGSSDGPPFARPLIAEVWG